MGNGPSAAFAKSTFTLDQYRCDQVEVMHTVSLAFDKCVSRPNQSGTPTRGLSTTFSDHVLTKEERSCVEEYSLLYTQYLQGALPHFQREYDLLGREMMERARQEAMKGR